MFPLQQGRELVIQISSPTTINNSNLQDQNLIFHKHQSDLHFNALEKLISPTTSTTISTPKKFGKSPKSADLQETGLCNDDHRKQKHRIMEKQRRQNMTSLCSTLRMLLPLEHTKGKRSISDHMEETTNYIRNLKMSVNELKYKRDDLKRQMSAGMTTTCRLHNTSSTITVSPCHFGVEILITTEFGEERNFSLSKLMKIMLDEKGLDVINYLSTRVGNKVLHTIKAEVVETLLFDQIRLRRKLSDLIN